MARYRLIPVASAVLAGLLSSAAAEAGSVTLAWDPNSEADLAGYIVSWGTSPGSYSASLNAGLQTAWTVPNLPNGVRYYFAVQAYNIAGLRSDYSEEVSTIVTDQPITIDDWLAKFGVSDLAADDDGDGLANAAEYDARTDPTVPNTWILAEGATGFFQERIALANPGTDPARVAVTFIKDAGAPISREYAVGARGRVTVNVNQIPGLESASVSAVINTLEGGVVPERTLLWSDNGGAPYAGHTGKAVQRALNEWYFAEGDANTFETWLLFVNATGDPASVDVTYMPEGSDPVRKTYLVAASSRFTVYTNQVPELRGRSFATLVNSSRPITAERSMYQSAQNRFWKIGHAAAGVEAPSTSWFVAEGCTAWMFDEYLLLANPNAQATMAQIRFLLPSGQSIERSHVLTANSRTTVWVDGVPGLSSSDVSAAITADLPIVVERSMYWPAGAWHEGHASAGVTRAGVKWALAEGENGGPSGHESYVLVANPGDSAATIRVTLLPAEGTAAAPKLYTVSPRSRFTLGPRELADGGRQFGVLVESVNEAPIVVERSMYWNALNTLWSAGTNETGVRLR